VGWAFDDEFECRTLQSVDRQVCEQGIGITATVSSGDVRQEVIGGAEGVV
jgi:hypothetical protein